MCPFFDYNNSYCRVTPEHHNAYRDGGERDYYCKDNYNYKNCGNYEAYESGDYKVER